MKIYIDGQFHAKEDAKISVFDHGLLYGDGVFEGIRAYNGRVFKLEEHIDRLYDSAKAILLKIPLNKEEMCQAVIATCRENGLRDYYIRLVVTRGEGTLGLGPERCPKPCVIIIAAAIDLYPEACYRDGLKVVTAATQRVNPAMLSPAIKSLNYLNNIMAKVEGSLSGAQEVLMLNDQGYVAECSADNVFVIKKGKIYTPPIYCGALGGITRQTIIELAEQMKIPLAETPLTRYDLFVADEMFLTGTGAEVIPAVSLDARTIGDGKPGPITQRMMKTYAEYVRNNGAPIYP